MTDEARTTWLPIDLAPIVANGAGLEPPPVMLARSDGEQLLYAGKIHWFAGEPESAKGWLALAAAAERIRAGEHVLYWTSRTRRRRWSADCSRWEWRGRRSSSASTTSARTSR